MAQRHAHFGGTCAIYSERADHYVKRSKDGTILQIIDGTIICAKYVAGKAVAPFFTPKHDLLRVTMPSKTHLKGHLTAVVQLMHYCTINHPGFARYTSNKIRECTKTVMCSLHTNDVIAFSFLHMADPYTWRTKHLNFQFANSSTHPSPQLGIQWVYHLWWLG